jgi:UDP-N-acetylmuramate: L-alanyl-gamma-D-glutamyl-meso-diaminopimelate ligase
MRVHFIAIGGSAMHNLALALHEKGDLVTGSDDHLAEPSRTRLQRAGLLPEQEGWFPEKIHKDLDAVILGMHARADNPELDRAKTLGIPVFSYPEFLYNATQNQTRVVVAGSHGKTTITAMVLHVLHFHQQEADFMVGAQLAGFETMVRLSGTAEFAVFEGDEYLSSPIDLRPKFHLYKPNITLISGVAWDHVNVFPTYADYYRQFEIYLDTIEPGGAVVYNETDPEVMRLVASTGNTIKKFAYGLPDHHTINGQTYLNTDEGPVALSVFGKHNLLNLEGARWLCNQMGITDAAFYEAIGSFKGASRRLELLEAQHGSSAYLDFAHAPSKVAATVAAVREQFPDHHVVACLELHTFSSLSVGFLEAYRGSLDPADEGVVFYSKKALALKKLPDLHPDDVRSSFGNNHLSIFDNVALLEAFLAQPRKKPGVLLLMSSGSFDGWNFRAFAQKWVSGHEQKSY